MNRIRLLYNHEMISLEPNSYNGDSSAATVVLKHACPSLVKIDQQMRIQPDLAVSWTVSPDRRVYRFNLRPGVRLHSGRLLDAELVAWNFTRLFDTLSNSLLAVDYADLESVKPVARDAVEFAFAEPCIPFLYDLGWRTYVVDDRLTQPVGAGPFRVVEWVRRSHVLLKRFEHYWEPGKPLIDEILVQFAPTADQRIAMIEKGDVDLVENVPAAAAAGLRDRGLIETEVASSPRKTVIAFNCKEPPFNDPRMRMAVAHALDRDAIRAKFLGARGRAVNGVLPLDDPWAIPLEPPVVDVERARALIREAGYERGTRIKAATTNVAPTPRVAAHIAGELAKVGLELDLRAYDDPPWWPYLYLEGHWQMAFQGASARPHPHTMFRRDLCTNGAFNPGGYSNRKLDAVVAEARRSVDEDRQRALYAEAQRIVHADMPVLPLYASDVFAGWRPAVRGFRPHPLGYIDLTDVTVE